VTALRPLGDKTMLDYADKPRLLITQKDGAHVRGKCSLCERKLHAFVRDTEEQAMLQLNRGFKHHCRERHRIVVPVTTRITTPRRSTRIAADILIEVQGEKFAYAGETITVNLHGALVRIAAPLKPGDRVTVHVHQTGKSAIASIVFADYEVSRFGIELECPDNIWGVSTPPPDWESTSGCATN
jgi:hypothetical protein